MKVSICIPTWEQYGYGNTFLSNLLTTITNQTYRNFNVIISDHSLDSEIEKICKHFQNEVEIIYLKNSSKRGNGPANTNHAIKNADGELIKIMFQDDFFFKNESLKIIVDKFKENQCDWLVCGSNHTQDEGKTFYNQIVPRWNDNIIYGVNTISSPSVLSFRNESSILFDDTLTMLMDCEIYYQFYLKYGYPFIVDDILITNRIHQHQISNLYNQDISLEINYIKNKYHLN